MSLIFNLRWPGSQLRYIGALGCWMRRIIRGEELQGRITVWYTELLINSGEVELNGMIAYIQGHRYFFIGKPLREQLHDFIFPETQRVLTVPLWPRIPDI